MIKEESIQQVKDLNILDVIRRAGVELKKKGVNYSGCCPLHNERTPSFVVNEQKQFFKCFGCGKGGDLLTFTMEHEGVQFYAAIESLAKQFNIELQYDEKIKETPEEKDAKEERKKVLRACNRRYQQQLYQLDENGGILENAALNYLLQDRKLTLDTILEWQLGYAPNDIRYLTAMIVEKGLYTPASEVGIVKTKNGSNYDAFVNRIMFPINNVDGEVIGFGGRVLPGGDDKYAKYLNSIDSPLYNKSKVLYGLFQAQRAIKKEGFAILVEGNVDVISFHQAGACNTIATCGTALTDDHCKLLKRFTDTVMICRDADAAGLKAALRDVDILLKHGFTTEVFVLPEGEDPDTFAMKMCADLPVEEIEN